MLNIETVSAKIFSAKNLYTLKAPKPNDYQEGAKSEKLSADYSDFIKKLMTDENAVPKDHLTSPTPGIIRSTDVFGRQYNSETKMLEFIGHNDQLVWQTYVPNSNWIKYADGKDDPEIGDAYLMQHNPYYAQGLFIRGSQMGQAQPVLVNEKYDNGQAYSMYKEKLDELSKVLEKSRIENQLAFTQAQRKLLL